MISNVRVVNYLGEELTMELSHPEKSGFLIYNMTGIGSEKADIRVTDLATTDGGLYNSARLPSRNIVINFRFFEWEGKTVEQIRHESYKYFPIKKPATLFITTGERVCEITGYVESNEPVVFSSETHTQLSLLCPFPYFYDGGPNGRQVTPFSGIDPRFEFPFSNESLTQPLLIMGEIQIYAEGIVVYSGDADVGVTLVVDALGPATNITVNKVDTREKMFINTTKLAQMTGSSIIAMDSIIISTVRGQKSIQLLRNGIYTNIINALDKGADWFELAKGDNIFAIEAETGIENLTFRVENRILFEGV